jgi:hypothetical protein
MVDRPRTSQETFDLSEDEISPEHLDSQVQKAQEQLLTLKRQQEQIERQKRELEELSLKQEQLQMGRTEMIEKFTRALVFIEREELETQRREETLRNARESFGLHLEYFKSLDLRSIEGADVRDELTRAISALDDARNVYNKTFPRIGGYDGEQNEGGGEMTYASAYSYGNEAAPKDALYWLKAGVAFTLPLVIVGILIFIALLTGAHH